MSILQTQETKSIPDEKLAEFLEMEVLAQSFGFERMGILPASLLEPEATVRSFCATNKCHCYGQNWTCPPVCGDLSHFNRLFKNYSTCMLVQTSIKTDPANSYRSMAKGLKLHAQRTYDFITEASKHFTKAYFLLAEPCDRCRPCTYPDEPCPYPETCYPSMEAAGLMVSTLCDEAGLAMHYTGYFTLTSAVLL